MAEPIQPPQEVQDAGTISVLSRAINPDSSPEDRKTAATLINKKITNDTEGHINTQMQVLPMIGALIGGNLKEAYNYYNGGPTRVEDALHPTLGRFQREYNSRGPTGRIFDQNGNELNPNVVKKLDESGGLISNTDKNAFYTGAYAAATENQKAFMTGLAKPVADQYQKSIALAQQGSVLRDALESRRALLAKDSMKPVVEVLSKMSSQDRQRALGFLSAQFGKTAGTSAETTAGQAANAMNTQNVQNTIGVRGAVGSPDGAGGPAGGIFPGGIGVNASRSTGGTTQAGASATTGATKGQTGGESESVQRNVMSEIQRLTQGAISTPEQFNDFSRLIQYTNLIDQTRDSMKPEDMAPGTKVLTKIDPLMNSRADTIAYDIDFQKNNALNVAWNNYLAKEMHSNIKNVDPEAIGNLRDKFLSTNTYKAIERTYNYELKRASGEKPQKEEGAIYIDRNNRLRKWVNDDWEPVNAK
jgi:hypothetical protein